MRVSCDRCMCFCAGQAVVNMAATADAEYTDMGAHCKDPVDGEM